MSFRVKYAKRANKKLPPKRFTNEKISIEFRVVQIFRMIVRMKSLKIWSLVKKSSVFDKRIKYNLKILSLVTFIYHSRRKV